MDSVIGVALLGLGNVGAGVVRLLADNARPIEARLGARLEVRAVVVHSPNKPRLVEVAPGLITTDWRAAVTRDDIAIVCELMGGVDEARQAVLAAIAAGKHVVTANKALLAIHGAEVFAAAAAAGVEVFYEAAVCGGVPVIRALREGLAADRIEHFLGIVNGTSNYILSTMAETGRGFAEVLAEAQAQGFAEADPTLDVDGGDAAHKLAILALLCFGVRAPVDDFLRESIRPVDAMDLRYAARFGYVVKPLVIGRDHGHAIELRVHPALVPDRWMLADVPGAKNAVYVFSYALGPSLYYGAGAGMLPTAMAVVSDLIEIGRNMPGYRAGAPTATVARHQAVAPRPLLPTADIRTRYYLRLAVVDQPGVLGKLMTVLGAHAVSIAQLVQDPTPAEEGRGTQIIVLTHEAREGDVRAALAVIDALPVVVAPTRLLRIAG